MATGAARQPLELPSHEALSELARDDPEAYETLRRELVDSFIANAPPRIKPRLSGLQFRVDSVRSLERSGLGSTVKLYELMWQSFLDLNHGWQDFVTAEGGPAATSRKTYLPRRSARVLEFRPRPPHDRA